MLRLHGIACRDFFGYRGEHTLRFRKVPGLYYVHGENQVDTELGSNDAGKTTLFSLIAWIIYGKTLRDERPGAAVESWDKTGQTYGILTLDKDGKYYRIERSRNPIHLRVKIDDGDFVEVDQAYIEREIVPLSFDAFKCTLILPQLLGEARPFLDLGPEEQSQLISVGLDVWLDAAETAGILARDSEADVASSREAIARIEGRMAELKEQIDATTTLFATFESETAERHKEVVRQIAPLEEELVALKRRMKPLPEDSWSLDLQEEKHELQRSDAERNRLIAVNKVEGEKVSKALAKIEAEMAQYGKRKCPECGQPVKDEFAQTRLAKLKQVRQDALADAKRILDILTELQEMDFSADIAAIDKAIAEAGQSYAQTTATMRTLATRFETVNAELGALYGERKQLETKPNPYKAEMEEAQKRSLQANSELTAGREKLKSLEAANQAYVYWRDAFRRIRLDLIDECLHGLEYLTNEAAEQLGVHGWRIELKTEQETKQGKVSRRMAVLLYPPGQETPVKWQSYGGGIAQRWQLAIRFALSELLLSAVGLEPSIEILDEPTAHLSPEGVDALMVYLRERAIRLQREIWVVEHHPLDETLFDATLNVVKTAEGSRASWNDAYEPLAGWDSNDEAWMQAMDVRVTPAGV